MGERRIINGLIYEKGEDGVPRLVGPAPSEAPAQPAPSAIQIPVNPVRAAREAQELRLKLEDQQLQRDNAARQNASAAQSANADARTAGNQRYDNLMKLRGAYESTPVVKEYRVGIQSLGAALKRAEDGSGDTSLIYDYAKAMDPGSVVREAEMGMAAGGGSAIEAAAAKLKKQFGIEGGGNLSPQVRESLKREIANKVATMNVAYSAQRVRFAEDAKRQGFDPAEITGNHDGDAFMPEIKAYQAARAQQKAAKEVPDPAVAAPLKAPPRTDDIDPTTGQPFAVQDIEFPTDDPPADGSYQDSYVSQGLSGTNEGLASVVGLPVDITTAAVNLIPKGVNALANTNLPTIENPILGGDWIKARLTEMGSIAPKSNDPTKQFTRRVGESVGASAIPAGFAGSLAKAGAGLFTGLTGGIGGATAQQVAPGNPLAEILGEAIGGGLGGFGALKGNQARAQKGIEEAIPTVKDLKEQASRLYQRAEQSGSVASPTDTRQLADDLRQTLLDEGQLGPAGRITNADNNTAKAFNLVEQYADKPMRPKEMDSVRRVLADSRKSPDASDQRLGKVLLDQFDQWVKPLAPDFDEARAVSTRYLQAEDLEEARELAAVQAGQFTGSGFENALRTQYRGLDRNTVKGRDWFDPAVSDAIQKVSRGTPMSNAARAIGRFAPTGTVSAASTLGVPAGVGMMAGASGPVGVGLGLTAGAISGLGRYGATKMGIRNANIAELTARNGGAIQQAPLVPDAFKDYAAMLAAVQQAKYLNERPQ